MDNFYLSAVVRELSAHVSSRTVARISLSTSSLLIDLRLSDRRQLVASLDRTAPAFYLSKRAASDTRDARTSNPFVSVGHKHLVDAKLVGLSKTSLDRIVELGFERPEADGSQTHSSLVLTFTGRSANAYLLDDQRNVISSLFDHSLPDVSGPADADEAARLTNGLREPMSQSDVVECFFGAGSSFSPQLKAEFLSRCADQAPAAAYRSLVSDLLSKNPPAFVYSRFALEEIKGRVIDPKADLLLSNIELRQAGDLIRHQFPTLSEAADAYYSCRKEAVALRSEYEQLRHRLSREINKLESALGRIDSDRVRFGEPETLKRRGDLILANLATARLDDNKVTVVDYYDLALKEIQIEIPEGATLEEGASDYFNRYRKARRAVEAIASRDKEVTRKLDPLKQLLQRLESDPTSTCIESVGEAAGELLEGRARRREEKRGRKKQPDRVGRWFLSTDGYEIAVGKNDRDNDALTFRIARPYDLWLHAADYPGSHVVIRNPTREDVPHRTIAEAAALAAFNSQAKREGKAAVHYAQKKFISKPPRAKPGLVRLSSFKTIMVEPRGDLKRIE